MPHSSGGGSHGGGSHSGGYSSYSSSSSGSRSLSSGDSSSTPSAHISRSAFPGARRYMYRNSRGRVTYLYSSGHREKASLSTTIVGCVIFAAIAILIARFLFSIGLYIPRPLDTRSYQADTRIVDEVGLPGDRELEKGLEDFLKATGVSPAVELVEDSAWEQNYKDLETFAYSEYLRLFDDECHWLIVISFPEDYDSASFFDWQWEGMIGDDCYPAFNSDSEELFTQKVQQALLRAAPGTLKENLGEAFTEFSKEGMKRQVSAGFVGVGVIVLLIGGLIVWALVKDYRNNKMMEKAVYAPEGSSSAAVKAEKPKPRLLTCEYCGRQLAADTVSECPYCGAPIKQ